MKLSINIPVYNGGDFIEKSYRSVQAQNLTEIEFEINYIDNNSQDASVEKIKALQKKDYRVNLYYQTLQGEAHARNMGIEKAVGDYLYQLDVDDEIYPGALQSMIKVLDENSQISAVFGKMVKSYQGIEDTPKPEDETHKVILKDTPYWGLHWFSSLRNVVGPPGFLYRRSVFGKIGNYNTDLIIGTDTAMDVKLGMTQSVAFLDSYVYLYFKHHQSAMQKAKKEDGMIFHTWKRLVKEHLPFYLEYKTPLDFKKILFRQLVPTMGKLIYYTKGYSNRKAKLEEMYRDIKPITLPFYIRLYLTTLVFLPLKPVLKFYVYYLSPWYTKKVLRSGMESKK